MMQKMRSRGFTLIELMIVVAVVAIIAAVAIPSYQDSVLKSKRAIGRAELMEVLSRQEQYFINNKAYATNLTSLGYDANPYLIDDQGSETAVAVDSIYQIALSSPTTNSFTIQAVPQNGQADDTQCGTLELSNTGLKGSTSGTAAECW